MGLAGGLTAPSAETTPAEATAALEIRVYDRDSGQPLPAVTVAVNGIAVVTDAAGIAKLSGLRAPGSYDVLLRADGYATLSVKDVAIRANETRVVPIALFRAVEESVEVVETPRVVSLEEVAPVTRFSGDFLEDLPVYGRDVQAMLTLAPGIQDVDGDGNPNVHGARERDFKVMIGDVSNQDPLTGLYLGYINPDTISDLEVLPVGAGAEYGRAQGGFARVVQKQGGNAFEGIAGFAFQTSYLDGNGAAGTPSEKVPSFKTLFPFLQFTGPIMKDRLWYRMSAEYRYQDEPLVHSGLIAVTGHRQLIADGELTWQATPQTKVALHLRHDPFTDTNVGLSATVPADSSHQLDFDGTTFALSTTSALSSRLIIESTAAVQDYEQRTSPMVRGLHNNCVRGLPFIEEALCFYDDRVDYYKAVHGVYSGSYNEDRTDTRRRFTLNGKTTYYANFLGAPHVLRAGLGVEDERFTRFTESRPFMNFHINYPMSADIPPVGIAATTLAVPIEDQRSAESTTISLWAEDQFRPRSNLSITLGLRYDLEQISALGFETFDPAEENRRWKEIATNDPQANLALLATTFTRYEGLEALPYQLEPYLGFLPALASSVTQSLNWAKVRRPSNLDISNGVISPRLSVAWDPFDDGKTKIALSAGRYYDKTFLAVPLVETDPATVSLVYTALEFNNAWYIVDSSRAINPALSIRQVDRNLRPPYQDEFALTLEREIAPEVVLRLVGISREFKDQFQDIDLNRTTGDEGRCAIQEQPNQPYVIASPGSGFDVTDAYTGQTYTDTDPGPGDGQIDDCTGRTIFRWYHTPFGLRYGLFPIRDGVPDLYLQNPAWGSVLRVGNYNQSRYHALVLELIRRQRRNWQMEASYTWSRAIGDAEDFLQTLGNDRSIVDDERGFLSYDQRHVVKVNAAVTTPWARLGAAVSWQSGLPFSVIHQTTSYVSVVPQLYGLNPPDPTLRTTYDESGRNSQRNRSYWNVDVQATKEFALKGGSNLRLTAEIFNLLNDDTYTVYSPSLKYGQRFDGADEAYRRFGRRYQLGIRVAF